MIILLQKGSNTQILKHNELCAEFRKAGWSDFANAQKDRGSPN